MTAQAKRPSCLIEGTKQYAIVQEGEKYFAKRNTDFRNARHIMRWVLDDTDYYGSTAADIVWFIRTMHADAKRDKCFKWQLVYFDRFMKSVREQLPLAAKLRLNRIQGYRYLFEEGREDAASGDDLGYIGM